MLFKQVKKIKKNKDFSLIYKKGRKLYFGSVGVFCARSDDENTYFGVTTVKKIKGAVRRNTVRRRALNSIKNETFAEGVRFVILLKETAPNLSFDQLKSEILQTLSRAGVIGSGDKGD